MSRWKPITAVVVCTALAWGCDKKEGTEQAAKKAKEAPHGMLPVREYVLTATMRSRLSVAE